MSSIPLSKINVAERQLVTAINLFFADGDAVAVHTLTSAARRIVHDLCEKANVVDLVSDAIDAGVVRSREEVYAAANRHANWFKHADRDAGTLLEGFSDEANDTLLFVAAHDFCRLEGEAPIEIQAYELWYFARNGKGLTPEMLDTLRMHFPTIQAASRLEQKAIGREMIEWARGEGVPRRPE